MYILFGANKSISNPDRFLDTVPYCGAPDVKVVAVFVIVFFWPHKKVPLFSLRDHDSVKSLSNPMVINSKKQLFINVSFKRLVGYPIPMNKF